MRLTIKGKYVKYTRDFQDNLAIKKITNKLGQLEDIEEELGIDLITLLTALLNGHVYTKEFGKVSIDLFFPDNKNWSFDTPDGNSFYIKNYGKTWALTKEELEK